MDLQHDNLGVEDITKVVQGVGDIRHSILVKAKTKKAQKISDAGGYLTLSAYQKSLIPVPAYVTAANIPAETAKAAEPIPATDAQVMAKAKSNLPLILAVAGGLILVVILIKK